MLLDLTTPRVSDEKWNALQVRVYFGTLEVTKITETKKWDNEEIMVGLGGTQSLFLGISLVATFEYAELLLRLIAAIFSPLMSSVSVLFALNPLSQGLK